MADQPFIDRKVIFWRGLAHACPNCGQSGLFASAWRMHRRCPHCRMNFDKEDGFYAGYLAILYGLVAFGWILPIGVLWLLQVIGDGTAVIASLAGALLGPVFLYRTSRSLWLAGYYCFFPHELPGPLPAESDSPSR